MKTRILVVEDDKHVQILLKRMLEKNDYEVDVASDGKSATFMFNNELPDIVLLDLGLPDVEGYELIHSFKKQRDIPVLVVSAREEFDEKVMCLDAGADDYVTKPFNNDELLARIRVMRRRHSKYTDEHNVYHNGALEIDYDANEVYLNKEKIKLTPMEYKLLTLLSQNTGKILTYNQILKALRGNIIETDLPSLRVFMTTLRKKIESDPKNPVYIQTHISVGYQMLKN